MGKYHIFNKRMNNRRNKQSHNCYWCGKNFIIGDKVFTGTYSRKHGLKRYHRDCYNSLLH